MIENKVLLTLQKVSHSLDMTDFIAERCLIDGIGDIPDVLNDFMHTLSENNQKFDGVRIDVEFINHHWSLYKGR